MDFSLDISGIIDFATSLFFNILGFFVNHFFTIVFIAAISLGIYLAYKFKHKKSSDFTSRIKDGQNEFVPDAKIPGVRKYIIEQIDAIVKTKTKSVQSLLATLEETERKITTYNLNPLRTHVYTFRKIIHDFNVDKGEILVSVGKFFRNNDNIRYATVNMFAERLIEHYRADAAFREFQRTLGQFDKMVDTLLEASDEFAINNALGQNDTRMDKLLREAAQTCVSMQKKLLKLIPTSLT